jgi:hypothetical protein
MQKHFLCVAEKIKIYIHMLAHSYSFGPSTLSVPIRSVLIIQSLTCLWIELLLVVSLTLSLS